jgi:hypothetical protein
MPDIWLPPEKEKPTQPREVRVITYWRNQTEMFMKLCEREGAEFLGAWRVPSENGFGTEWIAVYRHTENIEMEILC